MKLERAGHPGSLFAAYRNRVALFEGRRVCGSGGLLPTNSTAVVHFHSIDRREIRREELPSHCGRGHPLTPDNLRFDQSEHRWRCLRCGCDRAAAFRRRYDRTG